MFAGSQRSPGSPGSPSLATKLSKDKRSAIRAKINKDASDLAELNAKLDTLVCRLQSLAVGEAVAVSGPTGEQYLYTKGDAKNIRKHMGMYFKDIVQRALNINKGTRSAVPHGGFSAPNVFNDEICNFFATANIGPLYDGDFNTIDGKSVSVSQRQINGRLNDILLFTQRTLANGQENPMYGVFTASALTSLFYLYIYYANVQSIPETHGDISFPAEMRQKLHQTLVATIERDYLTAMERGLDQFSADNLRTNALRALDDPSHNFNDEYFVGSAKFTFLNVNSTKRASFSKIGTVARVFTNATEIKQRLANASQQIVNVYSNYELTRNVINEVRARLAAVSATQQDLANAVITAVINIQVGYISHAAAAKRKVVDSQPRQNARRKVTPRANPVIATLPAAVPLSVGGAPLLGGALPSIPVLPSVGGGFPALGGGFQ